MFQAQWAVWQKPWSYDISTLWGLAHNLLFWQWVMFVCVWILWLEIPEAVYREWFSSYSPPRTQSTLFIGFSERVVWPWIGTFIYCCPRGHLDPSYCYIRGRYQHSKAQLMVQSRIWPIVLLLYSTNRAASHFSFRQYNKLNETMTYEMLASQDQLRSCQCAFYT